MMILLEYIGVGLGAGFLLIILAKMIMAKLLQRDNDYYMDEYDEGGGDDE